MKVLPRSQCEGIKKYIVGLIIKTSSNPELMEKEKTYLAKLNIILGRRPASSQCYRIRRLIITRDPDPREEILIQPYNFLDKYQNTFCKISKCLI
jgi:hypothetical protein